MVQNKYLNKKLAGERIAEFDYQPDKCDRTYRVVVLHSIKNRLIGMDFTTFRDRVLMVPAQIIRRSRTLVYRLLSYRPSVDWLLLIDRDVRLPLRN